MENIYLILVIILFALAISDLIVGVTIELNENQVSINEYNLSFANDYSGIFYDSYIDKLWIISDESSTVTKCELNGKPIKSFHLSINQAEGIVVDSKNNRLYAVSDPSEKLYVYRLE